MKIRIINGWSMLGWSMFLYPPLGYVMDEGQGYSTLQIFGFLFYVYKHRHNA